MTDPLAEFLLAQIAADEAAARAAAGWDPSGRERAPGVWRRDGINSVQDSDGRLIIYGDGPVPAGSEADHIARHDPARVLAECAAKRAVIDLAGWHIEWLASHRHNGVVVLDSDEASARVMARVLHLLAQPYADHPDFDPDWKVET